jgi:serine/threonine protein kinase
LTFCRCQKYRSNLNFVTFFFSTRDNKKKMAQPAPNPAEIDANDAKVGEAIAQALAGKYELKKPVGRGSYGQVWLVESLSDRTLHVAKAMAQEKKHRFDAEVQCLRSCNHFSIVNLVDTAQSTMGPVILLEFADNGDLSQYIKAHIASKAGYLDEEIIGRILVQMVLALHHIHCARMMHRDIKSANVLMNRNGMVSISDFGFSRQFDVTVSSAVAETFLGTPYYLAPELWRRHKYSKKADVFSLGVVLYELMALRRPFASSNMRGLMQAIVNSEYERPPAHYSDGLRELLAAMLMSDPAKRPSTSQILSTPVVRGYVAKFLSWVATNPAITQEQKNRVTATTTSQMENLNSLSTTEAMNHEDPDAPEVLHEGQVHIGSVKEWKPRYVVLTPTDLVVTRAREDPKFQNLGLDTVVNVTAADPATAGEGVLVVSLNTSFTVWIKAANDVERDIWVAKINAARLSPPQRRA